jgi:hypothetical protein
VLKVTVLRKAQKPLVAIFGAVPLRKQQMAYLHDDAQTPILSNRRTELEQRLLAQVCELCDATENIEVHHIRKLGDLLKYNRKGKGVEWAAKMAARKRKTLVVCRDCHDRIHQGVYDGPRLSK